MRISDSLMLSFIQGQNAAAKDAVFQALAKSASGVAVSKPSDDPVKAAKIVQFDKALGKLASADESLNAVRLDLTMADQILAEFVDVLGDIQALGISMQNDSFSETDRASAAEQIAGLLAELQDLAATQTQDGRYLFGGLREDQPPYDADGNYQGSLDVRQVEVSPGVFVAASVTGAQSFGTEPGATVFDQVQSLVDALAANDLTAIQDATGAVGGALDDVLVHSAALGTRIAVLDSTEFINQDLATLFTLQKADVQEIDLTTELTNLAAAQNALTAVVAISQQILQTSLLTFVG